jgi:Transposase, Mutator family
MAKTSTAVEVGQEGSLREGLEAAIRERVREIIEMVLQEEVETALGAPRSQRVAERAGYRHGSKQRKLTLRTGTVQLDVRRGWRRPMAASVSGRVSWCRATGGAAGRLSRACWECICRGRTRDGFVGRWSRC